MSSFRIPPNHHLALIVAAILAVGVACGVLGASLMYGNKVAELEKTNASLAAFNGTQAVMISQMSLDQSLPPKAAPDTLAPASAPSAAAPATPQAAPAPPAAPSTPVATKIAAPPHKPSAPAKPVAAPPATAQTPPRTSPAQAIEALKLQKPVAATPSPPAPTTVTMAQAGISGIDTASVKFTSGRTVAVGGEFPTGERLISVSPSEGRIVTDRRVIQLAKPTAAQ